MYDENQLANSDSNFEQNSSSFAVVSLATDRYCSVRASGPLDTDEAEVSAGPETWNVFLFQKELELTTCAKTPYG